ncbi:MAG: hypothetical protein ACRCYN_03970 [Plesiomonas sp.]
MIHLLHSCCYTGDTVGAIVVPAMVDPAISTKSLHHNIRLTSLDKVTFCVSADKKAPEPFGAGAFSFPASLSVQPSFSKYDPAWCVNNHHHK